MKLKTQLEKPLIASTIARELLISLDQFAPFVAILLVWLKLSLTFAFFFSEMARVYDLEPFLEPQSLGCDKARISIEVRLAC